VVFADRLKPSYVDLLRAVGAACVAYGSDEQQIISAIRQHARRHDVADTPGGHQTVTGPVSGALTEREATIFDLLVEQRTHREIASCLQITPETVRKHAANIRRKLQADAHPPLEMLRAASCGPDT
jgi:FixJ family two-component response regulator